MPVADVVDVETLDEIVEVGLLPVVVWREAGARPPCRWPSADRERRNDCATDPPADECGPRFDVDMHQAVRLDLSEDWGRDNEFVAHQ